MLVATPGFATGRRLLVDAVLIALAANLANLLDRAPGRTIKAAAIAYVPLAIVLGTGPVGVAIAPVMGAAFGLLADDLRERLMLGDTGANVIGAILGLGVVLGRGEVSRIDRARRAGRRQRRGRAVVVQHHHRPRPTAALARPPRPDPGAPEHLTAGFSARCRSLCDPKRAEHCRWAAITGVGARWWYVGLPWRSTSS